MTIGQVVVSETPFIATVQVVGDSGNHVQISIPGIPGAAGNMLHSVSGAPGASLGSQNDWAIDKTALILYGPKGASVWPAGVNIGGGGGGGNGALVIQLNESQVSASAVILDFSTDFTATESPTGEANIGVATSHTGSTHAAIQSAAEATAATALALHSSASVVHAASAIPFTPNGSIGATNVQAAIQEVRDEAGSGTVAASAVTYAGSTNLVATNVEAALDELDAEKAPLATAVMDGDAAGGVLSGTYPNPGFAIDMATQSELDGHTGASAAHAASAVTYAGSTNLVATNVEAALDELDAEKAALVHSHGLDDLSDVAITSPAVGATLIWNGVAWVDGQLDLADADAITGILPDANIASSIARDSEVTNSINAHVIVAGAHSASAITNVAAGNISATDVQAAINELDTEKSSTSHSHTLDGLSDVSITSPATGSTVIFDGANWIDGPIDLADADAVTGILPDANIASSIARDSEVTTAIGVHTSSSVAHNASAIIYAGSTNLVATDVEAALDELDAEKSAVGHAHAASDTTSGVFDTARLGTGTAASSAVLHGDGWRQIINDDVAASAAIALTKLANIASAVLLGRNDAGSGSIEQLTAAEVKTLLAITSGDISDFTETTQDVIGNAVQGGAGVTASYDDGTGFTTIAANPAGYGAVTWMGDSRTQVGGGGTAAGDAANAQETWTRRVAAALNAPDAFAYGQSGAQLTAPGDGTTGEGTSGLGLIMRNIYPNHWYAPRSGGHSGIPSRPSSKTSPSLYLTMYSLNDPIRNFSGATTHGVETLKNHLRTMIARFQASLVLAHNTAAGVVAFPVGFGTTVNSKDSGHAYLACTAESWKKSTANSDRFEITIPPEFKGGKWFVTLIGPTNATSYLSASVSSSASTITLSGNPFVADAGYACYTAGDVIKCQSEYITLGSTADGGLTWTGCTRGVNGSTAASHASLATVTLPSDTIRVGWSTSTAPGASVAADTYVAGAGFANDGIYTEVGTVRKSPGFVTKVFDLTAADAGLKIVGVVSGRVGNEFVGFDSTGIIDPQPNPVVLVNTPDVGGTMIGPGSLYVGSVATSYNSALTTVASEFTDCVVVDHATTMRNRFYSTVQTTISNATTTTLKITPTASATCEINDGSVLRVLGSAPPAWVSGTSYSVGDGVVSSFVYYRCTSAVSGSTPPASDPGHWTSYSVGTETMLVTAIDKTNAGANDGTWLLTVIRGYESSTLQPKINSGNGCSDRIWWSMDFIHPSDYGHSIIAADVLDSIKNISRTSEQSANSGGLLIRTPRMGSGAYVPLISGTAKTTLTPTLGTVYSLPIEVTEPANLIAVTCAVSTAAGAGGIMRAGVRIDGGGSPGNLLAQLPTDGITTGVGASTLVSATGFIPLRPGIYWIDVVFQVAAPILRAYAQAAQIPIGLRIPISDPSPVATSSVQNPIGYTCTGETGALDTYFPSAGKSILAATTPCLWARFSVPSRD